MPIDLPTFGTWVICAALVVAAYASALAIASVRGRPHLLLSSRFAVYAACALVALAVLTLAYAFQAHDFRIRYVARYSDRSMPWWYLVTSLWGGQDGSLLWWSFLLSGYTTACVTWIRGKYVELEPYVLTTLMSILMFFCVLMLFAANPFATSVAATPHDGEGLNPLLQNYWMVIHPPSLYMGFVGWSVPFAFVVAALITGRLREEWIYATRKWVLVAWGFLSLGNLLGSIWSYEELGWGGYWAWDPVENAAFLPWLTGTAYLHSTMIQERRGMLKVWNVFLICLTFIMTIFGTFLTRSGLIASVHSFAKSDIGVYFVGFLVMLIVVCFGLIAWRLPKLRGEGTMDSLFSREFAFLTNNWILLGMQLFILLATTFPLISELIRGETVTVGPSYYNKWMVPLGLVLLLLMGVGPLMAWRKATGKNLRQSFRMPLIAGFTMLGCHIAFGKTLGFSPMVEGEELYNTTTGRMLASVYHVMPAISLALSTFVLATIVQEFWRGTRVRMKNSKETFFVALFSMVAKARRRYGGYIVHIGVICMFLGFTGAAYDVEKEAAIRPGEGVHIGPFEARYIGSRMEVDPNKRMVFADMLLLKNGEPVGSIAPAKFIYRTHPEMPTTEVAIRSTPLNDVYVIMNSINPESKLGTFKVIVRPLVQWIWIGGVVLLFGIFVTVTPSIRELLADSNAQRLRNAAPALAKLSAILFLIGALWNHAPVFAQADSSSSLHAGTVAMGSDSERKLFSRVLCQCGDCARLPLSSCVCGWAENKRTELRSRMASGETLESIEASYRDEFGPKSIAVPNDRGLDRALWAGPVLAMALGALGLIWMGRRWIKANDNARERERMVLIQALADAKKREITPDAQDKYDRLLDSELGAKEDT